MKILCVSDEVDPLVYSDSVKSRFDDVDFILGAGDLPLDYLEFIVSSLNKPLFFVFGNHNLGDFNLYKNKSDRDLIELNITRYFFADAKAAAGAVHIGGKTIKENGFLFAGLGGSMRYNAGENQYTNWGMKLRILKLIPRLLINKLLYGRYLDILLTHSPPEGIHDREDICHRGFPVFLWFMRVFKPKYLVHGHIHLTDRDTERKTAYYETTVVNAFTHNVIDFEKDSCGEPHTEEKL